MFLVVSLFCVRRLLAASPDAFEACFSAMCPSVGRLPTHRQIACNVYKCLYVYAQVPSSALLTATRKRFNVARCGSIRKGSVQIREWLPACPALLAGTHKQSKDARNLPELCSLRARTLPHLSLPAARMWGRCGGLRDNRRRHHNLSPFPRRA
jgi:hypothetical protein